MTNELDSLRNRFGKFLVLLFWLHVPVLVLVAVAAGRSPLGAALAGSLLAGIYHLAWHNNGSAPSTRYLSAVALMGQPALLVFLLSGAPWQMDMHMYFFATLALTIAWCDRRAVMTAAAAVALHHLLLNFVLPFAVFPGGGDLGRVLLHAVIVAFQTAVLVWLSDMLVESFDRIGEMSTEIMAKNEALEERTLEAESANRAKSMFLANMSHEIRTPMNAVLGFCHLALRTNMTPQQRDYIAKINDAGASLLRLINDILDFSKNEAGKLALEHQPFDVRASIDNQVHLATMAAKTKNVAIRATVDASVPDTLVGDQMRFNQVVLNPVNNAVKFTEGGAVTVSVDVVRRDAKAIMLQVSIQDTGIGMTEEQLGLLFHSFTQADSSTTRRFGGTGLGLAISKQIVELMGGSIRAESNPGEGSNFIFTVVMEVGDTAAAPAAILPPSGLSNLRVLVADDNPASREILHAHFAEWSMPVDLVASGAEALGAVATAALESRPYDLVLLDWKMPGLDGIATVKAMRADKKLAKMPVVLLVTAYGSDEFRTEAEAADIAAFLVKPVDPATLLQTITGLVTSGAMATSDAPDAAMAIPMVAPALRGLRVLLAEDNPINREIAVELLTDAGLEVDTAENGRIACERVSEASGGYAAVLMDVQMPEMDGLEATIRIRRDWPAASLPIIAMTAHAYEAERQRCFAAGMNDHVAKPVDPALLVQTLDRWLAPGKTLATEEPRIPAAEARPIGELPDSLPPFDIQAALARVNGKRPLLRKLIVNFGDTFADVVPALRAHLAEAKWEDARRLAHTLKGVAGSLEIAPLAAVAANVETALANGTLDSPDNRLDELERLITPAIAAAKSLSVNGPAAHAHPGASVDAAAVALAANDLRTALERRSLGARASFERFVSAMGGTAGAPPLERLAGALDQLDYELALQLLDDVVITEDTRNIQGVEA